MNIRRPLNRVLRPCGYQVAKISSYEPAYFSRPEAAIEIDDNLIASRVAPDRKHLWLVAPPKSGSTWLSALLAEALQWEVVPLQNGYYRREQEVDRRPLLRYPSANIFSPHQHCRASQPTIDFIMECRVTPVVQTRNIFDSVISFRDHLVSKDAEFPMVVADTNYAELSEERQYDFVIELALPWYFNFYASWFRMAESFPGRAMFVAYETLVEDPKRTLAQVLEFVRENRSEADIHHAVEEVNGRFTRKNIGVAGRGAYKLTEAQKAKIRNFARYYPRLDLSGIGL